MPVELPGFYFDEERNRYFPIASKPKPSRTDVIAAQGSHQQTTAAMESSSSKIQAKTSSSPSFKRSRDSSRWNLTQFSRSTCDGSKRIRAMHDILGSHYANSSSVLATLLPTHGIIKCFAATVHNGELHPFAGDSLGWLWTAGVHDSGHEVWGQELSLEYESEVKSISISGSKVAAMSFGPSPRVAILDLDCTGRTVLISLKNIREIWSSHLQNKSLVMGAHQSVVSLSDVELSNSVKRLGTDSDALTVLQQEHLMYAGCRNGTIQRFDMRVQEENKKPRYRTLYKPQSRAPMSVVHIEGIGEHQMLVSLLNDELMTLDMRYLKPERPVVQYKGHRNEYTHKLGIAMDPAQQFLFAAGDDRRVRGWSLHSGQPLDPPASIASSSELLRTFRSADAFPSFRHTTNDCYSDQDSFLLRTFPDNVTAMQVIDDVGWKPESHGRPQGVSLLAASEKTLYQFPLGQR